MENKFKEMGIVLNKKQKKQLRENPTVKLIMKILKNNFGK